MKYKLKDYNTFNINATCRSLTICTSVDEIQNCINNKDFRQHPHLILGEGSNILYRKNFDGFILKPELKGIDKISESENNITLKVFNGEIWDNLAQFCVKNHYYGIENLSLIPGNIGAATFQNIGAYGVEIQDIIQEVEAINIESGDIEIFTKDQCNFNYRTSIFKNVLKDKYLIISTTFNLSKVFQPNLEYSGLREEIKDEKNLSAQTIRVAVIKLRKSKLPDTDEIGNAGSFFKNPIVTKQKFLELFSGFADLKYYQIPNDQYKIPAGWMIEKCGWKGKRIGNVGTYPKQALVIVNYGNASGEDIYQFSQQIKNSVHKTFGIWLEEEVRIIP